MVEDFLLDMEDSSGPMWLQALRCMNCGNVSESVLQHNRQTQTARLLATSAGASASGMEDVPLGAEAITRVAA
jgi:hypothetical protein